jgi:hypothetical protein
VRAFSPVPVFVLAAYLVSALAACASIPRTLTEAKAVGDDFAFLDPGGLVYLTLDVPQSRPVLDLVSVGGIRGSQAAQALDMTATAAAAVYLSKEGRGFLLAARGRYPGSRLRFSLGLSPAWKKTRSETGGRYWRSGRDGLSVYVEPDYALISDGDPFPHTGGVRTPEGFAGFREGAALAGWVPDAEAPINRFLSGMQISLSVPADLLIFGVYPDAAPGAVGRFFARFRLELPSASHVSALASMISLVRSFIVNSDMAGEYGFSLVPLLFANPPVREDSSLILTTGSMDAGEIALLFNMFPVYSK